MNTIVRDEPAQLMAVEERQATVYPVILCGGSGKRLWPVSRHDCPKQFQRLTSKHSLIQETVLRARDVLGLGAPIILCNEEHRFMVSDHMKEIGIEPLAIVCEPVSRNTGAAMAAAAAILKEQDPNGIMLAMPSDHYIGDTEAFQEAFARAKSAAGCGFLVTFGIDPTRPETGYGYIEQGGSVSGAPNVSSIARFVEKPTEPEAERLISEGGYLWNSGMFVFPVSTLLKEFERLAPEVHAASLEAVEKAASVDGGITLSRGPFSKSPDLSIDVAIMERTQKAAVVKADIDWSDIGTWPAVRRMRAPDADGNVIEGNTVVEDVSNCLIQANGRLIAAVGLKDLIIVDTEDATLISSADRTVSVDRLVGKMRMSGQSAADKHVQVIRPWGTFQTVEQGDGFQVKHIVVKPGAELSLQMHHHRAEHWIVVGGTGLITRDGETELMHENQAIHIPLGASHRLENPGKIPLHLIEVQVGSYLGEDDIVRFDDRYGRV